MSERLLRWEGFYVRFSKVSNVLLTWTAVPGALKCLSLFLFFFFLFFKFPNLWSETICRSRRSLETHSWRYAVKVPESVWGMSQKLPFIRKKMGHINFDDLHNSMPHVISAECFQSTFRVSLTCVCILVQLVIIPQFTRGHEASLIQECDIKHEGLISIAIPSLMAH